MEVDYGILEEFNVNKEVALTHIEKSVQVKKFIEAICDNSIYKSIRKTKSNKLKELLRNINDWYCTTCNIQFYTIATYKKHMTGLDHKVKLNGGKIHQCSNGKCRKKFCSEDELEEHFKQNRKCVSVSPKNKSKEDYKNLMIRINKQKRLYMLYRESRETMTDLDKHEYNQMLINDYIGNEEYELVKDELGFLIVTKIQTEKPKFTIKETRTQEQIDMDLLIRRSKIQEEEIQKEALYRSNLQSDKYLGGPSSDSDSEYEEIEITDE